MAKDNPKLKRNGGEGTFLGKALGTLKDVSPALLDIIGTAIPGVSGLSNILGSVLGDKETPQATKDILMMEIQKDIAVEQELTKRLQSDNEHNVTRLVRPLSYGFAWVILAFIMFFDGNIGEFSIDKVYVPLIQDLIKVMTVFYFGSRGIEKVVKEYKK